MAFISVPLWDEAVNGGSPREVHRLLEEGADVNATTLDGETALHGGAYYGHGAIVKMLLDNSAAVNLQNMIGETPLHCAARRGFVAVVQLLLDKGADLDAKNNAGERTPGLSFPQTPGLSSWSCWSSNQ